MLQVQHSFFCKDQAYYFRLIHSCIILALQALTQLQSISETEMQPEEGLALLSTFARTLAQQGWIELQQELPMEESHAISPDS
jgi:hypothetical protein